MKGQRVWGEAVILGLANFFEDVSLVCVSRGVFVVFFFGSGSGSSN